MDEIFSSAAPVTYFVIIAAWSFILYFYSRRRYIRKSRQLAASLRDSAGEFETIFENNPVSCWLEDFSEVKKYFDELKEAGISEIEPYFREHPKAIARCAQIIKIKKVNQAALDLHNAKSKELLLEGLEKTFTPESYEVFQKEMIDIWNGKTSTSYDTVVKTIDNELRYVTISYRIVSVNEESLSNVLVTLTDITAKTLAEQQQKKLEKQLLQSQKMEAIGALAGGIAHNFNNILGAIIGYTEMARDDSPKGSSVANDLDKVLEASERAAYLVRQILAFSQQNDEEHNCSII